MAPLFIVLICFLTYFLGYRFYSRYISEKVFQLKGRETPTPAHTLRDDVDYIPTKPSILFGHHYASIAGLAPILGPAVAVIWGWLPAMVWVVLGGLFIGCVHDFGALVVSMRTDGKSVGQVAEQIISPRARSLFHAVIFFLVSLAMGVFVLVIAGLYTAPTPKIPVPPTEQAIHSKMIQKEHDSGELKKPSMMRSNFPESIVPTAALMVAAVIVGYLQEKKKYSLKKLTIFSLLAMFPIIYFSMDPVFLDWIGFSDPARSPSTDSWKWILLLYAFLASVTPVWLLLQSRDYINSFLLYLGIILVYSGFFVGSFQGELSSFHTEPIRSDEVGMELLPFVFITIACGAVSGFHSLVSSGTTAKQIDQEKDARFIGYGGMIGESLLGLTSIVACTVGFANDSDWMEHYRSWSGIQGLNVQVGAYINGTGRFLGYLGIPQNLAQGFIALIVISFALTSLDSATRLLRYNIEEIGASLPEKISFLFQNRYVSSVLACLSIAFFAFLKIEVGGVPKPAGLALWKLFGTTNQLLAGLALLVISIYLFKWKCNFWIAFVPMAFVLFVTLWAMGSNLLEFTIGDSPNPLLGIVGAILLILTFWLILEGFLAYRKLQKLKE
jgi:carbon starvation protein